MGEMGEYCAPGLSIVDLGRGGMVLARSLEVGSEDLTMLSLRWAMKAKYQSHEQTVAVAIEYNLSENCCAGWPVHILQLGITRSKER